MHRLISFLCLSLISTLGFAKHCQSHRSCLELHNNSSQTAQIKCNGLDEVFSPEQSQGSTQLDRGYGDGLGAPEPRQLDCTLRTNEISKNFSFYNPYWGANIDFKLKSEKGLEVVVGDGWGSKKTYYAFNW